VTNTGPTYGVRDVVNNHIRKAVVLGAILLGAQLLVALPASAAEVPFNGTWTSVDTDGSNQQLIVRGSGSHSRAVTLLDDAGTVCGGPPATVSGAATMRGPVTCQPGGNPFHGRVLVEFLYDSGTDTLVEQSGVVWHRSD
jgi:hypothetical protein